MKKWYRFKLFFTFAIEDIKIFLSKTKFLLIFLLVGMCALFLHWLADKYWINVQTLFQNPTVAGIIGTLLGAFIGGFFSLFGSIAVSKYQMKAQNQIRRKNVIYKPLYDELSDIHNNILKINQYPRYISFEKEQQTIQKYPQYVVWGRIKSDSRFLETPKKLVKVMEKLEFNIASYLEIRHKAADVLTSILTDILSTELNMGCYKNAGDLFVADVLLNRDFDLFDRLYGPYSASKEIDTATRDRVQKIFVDTCRNDSTITCLENRHKAWMQSEEDAITVLSVMIRKINTIYEG